MVENHELTDILGKPRVFKGRKLYPIKVRDAHEFYESIQTIMLPKNAMDNEAYFRMYYLQFLALICEQQLEFEQLLETLLKLVFKCEKLEWHVTHDGRVSLIIDGDFIVKERDFDKIRKVICEQNCLELDDRSMTAEARKILDDAAKFNSLHSNTASFAEQIVAYHCEVGIPYREIEELTLYQFQKGITRKNYSKEADNVQMAKYYPMMDFKDTSKLPHWLDKIKVSKEDDATVKLDTFLSNTSDTITQA